MLSALLALALAVCAQALDKTVGVVEPVAAPVSAPVPAAVIPPAGDVPAAALDGLASKLAADPDPALAAAGAALQDRLAQPAADGTAASPSAQAADDPDLYLNAARGLAVLDQLAGGKAPADGDQAAADADKQFDLINALVIKGIHTQLGPVFKQAAPEHKKALDDVMQALPNLMPLLQQMELPPAATGSLLFAMADRAGKSAEGARKVAASQGAAFLMVASIGVERKAYHPKILSALVLAPLLMGLESERITKEVNQLPPEVRSLVVVLFRDVAGQAPAPKTAQELGVKRLADRVLYTLRVSELIVNGDQAGGQSSEELRKEAAALARDPQFLVLPASTRSEVVDVLRWHGELPPVEKNPDSTVEIELPGDWVLAALATTPSGTLKELVDYLPADSPWKARAGEKWDSVDPQERVALVDAVIKERSKSFWKERRIPALVIRKSAYLDLERDMWLRGRLFSRGPQLIDLASVFRGDIERANHKDGAKALEVHFRDDQSAGTVAWEAPQYLSALGVAGIGEHEHVVAEVPYSLKSDPELESAMLADYYRRLNLFAEMMSVIDEGGGVAKRGDKKVTFFGYLTPGMLKGVRRYLEGVGRGRVRKIADAFKMAWIGFRGEDTYDRKGVFGFEARFISSHKDWPQQIEFLDQMQHRMITGYYGIPREDFEKWLEERKAAGQTPDEALAAQVYHQPWTALLRHWEPEIKLPPKSLRLLRQASKTNAEAKLFFHDWQNEPALIRHPEVKEKLLAIQKEALRNLAAGKVEYYPVRFLLQSGLYDALAQSLGLTQR